MDRDITLQEYENVLDLCENLQVSERAANRLYEQYFNENALLDGVKSGAKAGGGLVAKAMKALANAFYKKNKPTTLIVKMTEAIDIMIKAINSSDTMKSSPKIAESHIAMLEEYKAKIAAKQADALNVETLQTTAETAVAAAPNTENAEGDEAEGVEGEETAGAEGESTDGTTADGVAAGEEGVVEGGEETTETEASTESEEPTEDKKSDEEDKKDDKPEFGDDGGDLGESLKVRGKKRI